MSAVIQGKLQPPNVWPYSSGRLPAVCTLVPPLNSVTVSAGTDVGRGSLKQPEIKCLTLGLSRGMNGVTLSYCYSGNYPTRG